MKLNFTPIPTDEYTALIDGKPDAHNNLASRAISDGAGMPCRHCLDDIAKGDEYLSLAYSPFDTKHVYAEVGPIFLHAEACKAYSSAAIPPSFLTRAHYMIRGYSEATNSIMDGTGKRIKSSDILIEAAEILTDKNCAYVHLRSATNTCFACRVERA